MHKTGLSYIQTVRRKESLK